MSASLQDRVHQYLQQQPRAMTAVMARDLAASEAEVIRALPEGHAVELRTDRFSEMMERLSEFGQVHVIVSNSATTLEAFGTFGNFSTWGEYFNVQTKSLDMHIRYQQIGSIFAVQKPSHLDGVPTLSIQFFHHSGESAFKVFTTFGVSAPSDARLAQWTSFRDEFGQ